MTKRFISVHFFETGYKILFGVVKTFKCEFITTFGSFGDNLATWATWG